jgi:cation:H+ antiporter
VSPLVTVLVFLATGAVVVIAGTTLARAGDVIAARTQLGGLWVGLLFLAAATSLPELATDISAVRLGAPNLAAGDLFGSGMANMLILALISLLPGTELFQRAALDSVLTAALAITVTCIAAIFVLMDSMPSLGGIGLGSVVLALTYVAGARAIFQHTTLARSAGKTVEMVAQERVMDAIQSPESAIPSLRRAVWHFGLAAVVILVAAPFFAHSAQGIAELTGLATSLIGICLLGLATSLPELVTSLAAVRLRAYDLAIGNLFGSNAFNMLIILPLDVAHRGGPILGVVSDVHAIAAMVGVLLMAIALAAIVYRAEGRLRMLEPSGLIMLLAYLLGLVLIFNQS